jgi:hypothetical protein
MESTRLPDDQRECRMCYRCMAPALRAVRSGLVLVCPHCLTPCRDEQASEIAKNLRAYGHATGAYIAYGT